MVNVKFESGKRDADWLIFDGTASLSGLYYILRPSDLDVSIEMEVEDVYLVQDGGIKYIFVRRGSQYKSLRPDPGFDLDLIPLMSSRVSSSCPRGSRCFGGVEYCCGSDVAVNNCYGRWKCPGE